MIAINNLENLHDIVISDVNLVFLIAGNISIQAHKKSFEFNKRSAFFHQSTFKISSSSPYLNGYTINISYDYLNKYPQLRKYFPHQFQEFKKFKLYDSFLIEQLLKELLLEKNANPELFANYLVIVLKKLQPSMQDAKPTLYQRFIESIDDNIKHNYCANSYANILGVDLKKLISEVKKEAGMTPCAVITQEVIKKAQFYLLNSKDSSKVIAYRLGFNDPYYFIKYFKKHIGITPTQYRKHH